jgi:DNA-binding PadR family transcriptional regulator
MGSRGRSNPLALAVLACVNERPMHPYDMATTMKSRGQHESIKLNYGSLYTVVESLQRRQLIEPIETVRQGRRPERTIYAITEAGKVEFVDWLSELIGEPAKEYTQFEAGLTLLAGLPPDDVLALLKGRRMRLALDLEATRSAVELASKEVPQVFMVEVEYRLALRNAELAWLDGLIQDIETDTLDGMELWRSFHADHDPPQ